MGGFGMQRYSPVTIQRVHGAEDLFPNISQQPALFDGCRSVIGPDGSTLFEGRPVPHFLVVLQDKSTGENYLLQLLGTQCEWTAAGMEALFQAAPDFYDTAA